MKIIIEKFVVNVILKDIPKEVPEQNGSRYSSDPIAKERRIKEAKKLYKEGLSYQEIAAKMDLSYPTISTYLRGLS